MKNKNQLTHAQHKRIATKALKLLGISHTMTKCLPEELGTSVAEEFAEAAMESAVEAVEQLRRIKCSLRLARKGGAS